MCKLNMKLIIHVKKKMMSSSLYCQVAVQVSSCSAKGTNWSVFDQLPGEWVGEWVGGQANTTESAP